MAAEPAPFSPESAVRRRDRSGLRDALEHAVFRAAFGGLALLPRGSSSTLGSALASAYFSLAPRRRRILLANLSAAFPEWTEPQVVATARACVASFGAALMEFLDSPRYSRQEMLDRVSVVGEEHLAAARARGRGVFLLSAHFGSWELGAIRAGLIGEPIAPVVRPLDNPRLEAELARRRTRFGNQLIAKKDAAREILRAMRANRTVAILVDQNVIAEEAIFVPFFGRLAATNPSLALLQLKTDAAVVPAFTWPAGAGKYRLEFGAPILAEEFAEAGADRAERVRRATARYMAVTETAVRGDPAAWLWMHERWKTRPADVEDRKSEIGNRKSN
jgi:KDO2-lipid IV(A) lauroyltransferase